MATAWRTPAFPISVACNRASSMKWRSLRIPIKVSFSSLSSSSSTNGDGEPQMKQLVLYTKQGCCLCEGLKEKLDVAFSLSGTHSLHNVRLLVSFSRLRRLSPPLFFQVFKLMPYFITDERHRYEFGLGEIVPIRDSRTCQGSSGWHRGKSVI